MVANPKQKTDLAANDQETRPQLLALNADGIPNELKENPRWAPFKAPWNAGRKKFDKIPVNPSHPSRGLSTSRPDQWASFDDALTAYEANQSTLAGVGYLMTGQHGIVGYDLDGCVKDGVIDSWALEVAKALNSHTEISLSGKGLRIFCRGKLSEDWVNHSVGLEAYGGNSSRFLTVTGCVVDGFPFDLTEPNQSVHEAIASKYRKVKQKLEVLALPVPNLVDGVRVPDGLPEKAERFLAEGECVGDRSEMVAYCAICLIELGLTAEETFSVLMNNQNAHGVAMDHRKQDEGKAAVWIWKHQVLPAVAKQQAKGEAADFEDCSQSPDKAKPLPSFERDKQGAILATLDNLTKALLCEKLVGCQIRQDDFRAEVVLSRDGAKTWEPLTDACCVRLRLDLERRGFKTIGRELMRDALDLVCTENQIDTAIYWLKSVIPAWDGVQRIKTFHPTYLGTEDSEYTRAISRYLWTALAGRVLSPGIKADMALVWVGRQGIRKTSACKAIVPSEDHFTEIDIDERRESDNSRKMRGSLVAELAELKGLQSRQSEYVKAFITRTHEEWIPKFKERAIKVPRRLVFIGTTNEREFLGDEEERRWLPVDVGMCKVDDIARDRDQLWAEAREAFKADGIAFADAELLAKEIHSEFKIGDPWANQIARWLDTEEDFGITPADRDILTTDAIAREALRIEIARFDRKTERRVGAAMKQLGFIRNKKRIDGKNTWRWVRVHDDETCS